MAKFVLHLPLMLVAMGVVSMAMVVKQDRYSGSYLYNMYVEMMEVAADSDMPNLPGLAKQLGLNELVDAVQAAGLLDTLSGPGPFTVFGPTDEAFASIPPWISELIKNKTILADVLKYHVLSGKVFSKSIENEATVKTALEEPLRFNIYNKVVTAQCKEIDVSRVDENATNGVLHVLKGVMIPPTGNIVQLAQASSNFSTLVTALQAAGLVDTLSGAGPFTVLAPTDSAFDKLDPAFLKQLLKDKEKLTYVLTYHVAGGTKCSIGLSQLTHLDMLNKKSVSIKVDKGNVVLNDKVNVLPYYVDTSVTNGVLHAIDTVLIPPSLAFSADDQAAWVDMLK